MFDDTAFSILYDRLEFVTDIVDFDSEYPLQLYLGLCSKTVNKISEVSKK
jgi:hypothetical protein